MSNPTGTRLFCARKAVTEAAAAVRNWRLETDVGVRRVIEISSGHGLSHFFQKRGDFFRSPAAERFERHKAAESDLVDDLADLRQIDGRLLSVHIHELFDL